LFRGAASLVYELGAGATAPQSHPSARERPIVKLLTLARDLQRRKSRERNGLFVAEGIRTVEELARSPLGSTAEGALIAPSLESHPRGAGLRAELAERGVAIQEITDAELRSAAGTDSPQGVIALGRIPERKLAGIPDGDAVRILVLDAVQDPGNVGTILRTAAALDATATVALPGTVDLWNAKVVRSAMGAQFHHFCLSTTWDELAAFRGARALPLWAADAGGQPIGSASAPRRLMLAVGNEGNGLSPRMRQEASEVVSLPIAPGVESLNVAVATGILLYEVRR
jgi:TrmH family RNA methyltransferase